MDTTPIRNLGHLRGIKGLSQKELAYKCRIVRTTLSKIESGRLRPSIEEVRRIAEALGTTEVEVIDAVKQMDTTLWTPKSDRMRLDMRPFEADQPEGRP